MRGGCDNIKETFNANHISPHSSSLPLLDVTIALHFSLCFVCALTSMQGNFCVNNKNKKRAGINFSHTSTTITTIRSKCFQQKKWRKFIYIRNELHGWVSNWLWSQSMWNWLFPNERHGNSINEFERESNRCKYAYWLMCCSRNNEMGSMPMWRTLISLSLFFLKCAFYVHERRDRKFVCYCEYGKQTTKKKLCVRRIKSKVVVRAQSLKCKHISMFI